MKLLELLHNEKIVSLLEKIDTNLKDIIEENNDFSNVVPSILFMLEMLLSENKVSSVSDDIFVEKEYQNFLKETEIKKQNYETYLKSSYKNKSEVEKKIVEYLKEEIIINKKLNYGNI